ncbi:hypothetical protein WLF18_14085 [Pseudomonas shirazensis]|jgi:hypothetical protein|uniref:Uncharacterized protein n=3 Tax=Pseudomonas TaxID=286 RepID=A0A2S3W7Z5_PSEPU|nr:MULTISPECIES: hypothetical protein [Pseudomonas]AUF98692.1 hypothetical protein CXQ80_24030 [Pseudomonas sp. 02C 26]MBA1197474.1 hypothetical protein [Pseudomonas plecoglossicida]MBA1320462.1 hypothetical protein [Pseudomonas plecoglossicida]MBO0366806.1 hypothetical protein [Pseudomonas putida]MCS4284068.1 hypothetical protein [Pseudomonas sp. BIGb0278]
MTRDFDGSFQPNAKARKQQQKDQRRMEFRRAIESYSEQRQLLREIADYSELRDITVWQVLPGASPKNAPQAH